MCFYSKRDADSIKFHAKHTFLVHTILGCHGKLIGGDLVIIKFTPDSKTGLIWPQILHIYSVSIHTSMNLQCVQHIKKLTTLCVWISFKLICNKKYLFFVTCRKPNNGGFSTNTTSHSHPFLQIKLYESA
jgi:hypothetical protein